MPATTLLAILTLTRPFDPVVDALKSNCIPLKSVEAGKGLDDMKALKETFKDVKVVGMGEPTHGSREVFQMKHRMFEFLVEEMGYTVFALEASMPDCVAMDRYVLTGEGDVNKAVWAQGFWTWSTEEVADLIKWMRKYNLDPAHKTKLRVVGVDMQSRYGAAAFLMSQLSKAGKPQEAMFQEAMKYPRPDLDMAKIEKAIADALPAVKEKLGAEEAELVKQVGVVLKQAYLNEKVSEWRTQQRKVVPYLRDIPGKAADILKANPDLKGDAVTGLKMMEKIAVRGHNAAKEDGANLRKYAKALLQSDKEDLKKSGEILEYYGQAFETEGAASVNWRDKCMADNTRWVVDTYMPGQKAMLWAHNGHIARWEQPQMGYRWMGAYLTDLMKSAYYPVGFSFYEGSFQAMATDRSGLKEWTVDPAEKGTLDEVFNQVGQPRFFVDFLKLDGEAKTWMDAPRLSRSIGAVYGPDYGKNAWLEEPPKKLFSGMIFIQKTTRARPLAR